MTIRRNKDQVLISLPKSWICGAVVAAAALFAGCDSGPGSSSSSSSSASSEAHLQGLVQDQHGPIVSGKVEAEDKNGQIVASTNLDGNSNSYKISIPSGTAYPVILKLTPPAGSNSVPVKAVVTSSLADFMDITDVSTLVVENAVALGGLTAENIAKASGGAIGLRQRQGVSAASGGSGGGPGNSGGGTGHGGHAGHDMSGSGGSSSKPSEPDSNAGQAPQQNMQH